ncbi:unnamed protein product [Arabidopsis lyrata]|nr:unnamed protein product [Arabidopsis lyrata]
MDNVRKLITEAERYQLHLIAPEQGYRRLIESCLVSIRGPAEAAVDAVHSICKDLIHKSMGETSVRISLLKVINPTTTTTTLMSCEPWLCAFVMTTRTEAISNTESRSIRCNHGFIGSNERREQESNSVTSGHGVWLFIGRVLPQDSEKDGNPTH